jgi:DNA-nicking Smr family endonuclease
LRKEDDGAVEIPIDGTLDLHTFKPSDVKDLVPEYLRECAAKGILRVRIIHGKGIGVLARTVRSILGKMPEVVSFETAGPDEGSWGATIVRLRERG